MKATLTIALSALMLAGCAEGYDKSADINDCKLAASANRANYDVNLGSGYSFESSIAGIPGQGVPGGTSDRIPHDISAPKCIHSQDSNGAKPKTIDLQKIG